MTTRTSVGSGLWSAAGTWDTGVPADNDVVVIAVNHTVEFDVDQSGFANGIDGITITGTLKLTRTAGTYYLKIKAAKTITGAGTFDCGTSGDVIGFTAKHTVTGGDGWYINGALGLTMTVYGTEPTNKTILLSGAEAVGQTVLSVDTDVTGDIWAPGDSIKIDNISNGASGQYYVIGTGGISPTEITITPALTASKITGALVHLLTRHLKFISVGATGYICQNFSWNKLVISGGEWCSANNYRIFNNNNSMFVYNGVFWGAATIFASCLWLRVYGGIFCSTSGVFVSCLPTFIEGGTFSGNTYVVQFCRCVTINGGIFKGNEYVLYAAALCTITGGVFTGNGKFSNLVGGLKVYNVTGISGTYIFLSDSGVEVVNCTLSATSAIMYTAEVFARNTLFTGTEYTEQASVPPEWYSESIDHNQVPDAYKAWSEGGTVTSISTPVPPGCVRAYALALINVNYQGHFREKILVPAGKKITITSWLRKSASMAYLPRVWIFEDCYEPYYDATKIIDEFIMTNSIDVWESHSYVYENTSSYDKTIQVRVVGKNTGGYVYTQIAANFGGVSRARILGGAG